MPGIGWRAELDHDEIRSRFRGNGGALPRSAKTARSTVRDYFFRQRLVLAGRAKQFSKRL